MENIIKHCWSFFEQVCYLILVKILHIKINPKAWEGLMQFVKFGIIGVSNTLISYVIYLAALVVFQKNNWFGEMDYLIAQISICSDSVVFQLPAPPNWTPPGLQ